MRLQNKTVLVTGAGGFIGSHLVEALLEKSAKVKALVRYNSKRNLGNLEFLEDKKKSGVDILFADVRESEILVKAMRGIDIVFNLAALVGIPYSYLNPHEVIMTNVVGTLNTLAAARDAKVEKFIQTSTSEVYGTPAKVPIKESDTLRPQSPYSASKIGADAIALSFYYSFGLPVSIIRPFNAYGPRQSARAVIPSVITQALNGNTIRMGSVSTRRDFTYVKDTVAGFIKIAESDSSLGEAINIGSGRDVAVGEIVNMVSRILGKRLEIARDAQRIRPAKSEVKKLLADNLRARKLLNWAPVFSLEEGLRLTIDFIASYPEFYNPREYAV